MANADNRPNPDVTVSVVNVTADGLIYIKYDVSMVLGTDENYTYCDFNYWVWDGHGRNVGSIFKDCIFCWDNRCETCGISDDPWCGANSTFLPEGQFPDYDPSWEQFPCFKDPYAWSNNTPYHTPCFEYGWGLSGDAIDLSRVEIKRTKLFLLMLIPGIDTRTRLNPNATNPDVIDPPYFLAPVYACGSVDDPLLHDEVRNHSKYDEMAHDPAMARSMDEDQFQWHMLHMVVLPKIELPFFCRLNGLLPKPVIYTTKNATGEEQYERVFTPTDELQLHAVFMNSANRSFCANLNITLSGPTTKSFNSPIAIGRTNYTDLNLTIPLSGFPPGRYTVKIEQNCSGLPTNESAECNRRNANETAEYAFFVDDFGVPAWTRDMRMLNIANPLMLSNGRGDYSDYETALDDIRSYGFNTAYIVVEYYQYNWLGANQLTTINSWIPSGNTSDYHYSNPPEAVVKQSGGLEPARDQIRSIVSTAQQNYGLKVVGYVEPMFIYSPATLAAECDGPLDTCWDHLIPYSCCRHELQVAHQNASSPSYVRFENGAPRRVRFVERNIGSSLADIDVETSFCGDSPESATTNLDDNYSGDPDYSAHLAHEAGWLAKNYNFDGILFDDVGRADMSYGTPADNNDLTSGIRATSPASTDYGATENGVCAGDPQKTLDTISGTLLAARKQMRASGDKAMIISDYVPAADAGWNSLYAASDVYNSDQFFLTKGAFARYAYTNWNASFKPMKTDMRRSLLGFPYTQSQRPAWMRGVLTAIAWSNRVNMEVHYQNDLMVQTDGSDQDTRFLFQHYNAMRDAASTPDLPIFSTQVSQDLLYHSALSEFINTRELQYCGTDGQSCAAEAQDEPYTVLYRLPGPQGEQARILHVINTRVICPEERTKPYGTCLDPILFNNDVPADYYFKVRIPEGYNVSRVVLVSPDTKLGETKRLKYDDYFYDVPLGSPILSRENGYLKIQLTGNNKVITYTVVYIEFKPEWS